MDLDPVITRSIELCPNCALSARQARLFFLSVAGPALLFAALFASRGLWPVLQRQALFVRLSRLIGPGGSSPSLAASGSEGNG